MSRKLVLVLLSALLLSVVNASPAAATHVSGATRSGEEPLAVAPSRATWMYFGTADGRVFSSRSGGARWQFAGNPGGGHILQVEVHPLDAATVYAGTVGGLFISNDAGGTWRPTLPFYVKDLVIDNSRPADMYALVEHDTGGPQYLGDMEIWRSVDGGENWSLLGGAPLELSNARYIALVEGPTKMLLAATSFAYQCCQIEFRTVSWVVDSGVWQVRYSPASPLDLTASTREPGVVYTVDAGYRGPPQGVFASLDSGASWQGGMQGDWETGRFARVRSVAASATEDGTAYAVADFGADPTLFTTRDYGATWSSALLPTAAPVAVVADVRRPGTVFVVAEGDRIIVTRNRGRTWHRADRGLPKSSS